MYPCTVTSLRQHPDLTFTSAEQYMMYCKASTFNEPNIANEILKIESPTDQKYRAKSIKASTAGLKEWQRIKYSVVVEGNLAKFGVGHELVLNSEIKELRRSF